MFVQSIYFFFFNYNTAQLFFKLICPSVSHNEKDLLKFSDELVCRGDREKGDEECQGSHFYSLKKNIKIKSAKLYWQP